MNLDTITTADIKPGDVLAYRLGKRIEVIKTLKTFDGSIRLTYAITRTADGKDLGTFTDEFDAHDGWSRLSA